MNKIMKQLSITFIGFGFMIFPFVNLLSVHRESPPLSPQSAVVLGFFDNLCNADWYAGYAGAPYPDWPKRLPCPGKPADENGFVQPLGTEYTLENGGNGARSFETHPTKQSDGFIRGTFSLSRLGVVIQNGDRLVSSVGFIEGAKEGYVRFSIVYDPDPIESGNEHTLFEISKRYNGQLSEVNLDLSAFAGQRGDIILRVDSLGTWSQDRAVWVNMRIERGPIATSVTPPTPTYTKTTTPSPSFTLPPTGTTTPTLTVTPLPTPTATSSIVPGQGCQGTTLKLMMEPLQPGPEEKVTFTASAASGCELEKLQLWVNNQLLEECLGSRCEGEGGPFPNGVHIFSAFGLDELGNAIYPANVMIEGQSLESNFDHLADPIQICPLCPELPGLGECIEQICTGPSAPDYYERGSADISCVYENVAMMPVEFEISIPQLLGEPEPEGDYVDHCDSLTELVEYYCQGTGGLREIHYECSVGCEAGACIPCEETDNGFNIPEKGWILNDPFGREETCISTKQQLEYYCIGNELREHVEDCEICLEGVCHECEDSDGGVNPFLQGTTVFGTQDSCLTPPAGWEAQTLREYFTWMDGGVCQETYILVDCPNGCNEAEGICNPTCTDGIQNQNETGIDCGGECPASCINCWGTNLGGGGESGRFSLNESAVHVAAAEAILEYTDCLRDPSCRATLPPTSHARIFSESYSTITAWDVIDSTDAIMEAVAYYVDKHMTYMMDASFTMLTVCATPEPTPIGATPGGPTPIPDCWVQPVFSSSAPRNQSARYTIEESGARYGVYQSPYGWVPDYCPTRFCGDCEDHAILREALLRTLGISEACAMCADYYSGYWGGGHTFNIVNYRNRWRIMDYGTLGGFFTYRASNLHAHVHNVWNDSFGVFWCPDWKDNLGDGHYDAGCSRTHPKNKAWNYYGGAYCPASFSQETYYSDTCP
jgi:hypothetical protein